MVLIVVFGVALLIAVLLSGLAARTVLSTSLLFPVGGALLSDGLFGWLHIARPFHVDDLTDTPSGADTPPGAKEADRVGA